MNDYDPKSCNALEKAYYTPMEAAIRWCNLVGQETQILNKMSMEGKHMPDAGDFPQWPCLRVNAEKIMDAINNDNLRYGRDGRTVDKDDHVAPPRRTVRHTDLKEWMVKNFPSQTPAFLFDETERNTHSAINADSFRALQADCEVNRLALNKKNKQLSELKVQYDALEGERNSLKAMVENQQPLNERAEKTHLNIIGGLLRLLLGKSSSGVPYSTFKTQESVIEVMLAYFEAKQGISERTLQAKFAAAKKNLTLD